MKKFEIFRYLRKWMPLIIVFFVGMTVFSFQVLEKRQRYTASSVIEYSNAGARDGLAPDESEIDVSEIYSSSNMAKVMENLGLSRESYSLDTLCAGISVTPVIEEQDISIQDAVNEEGEEYTVHPTVYIVNCTLDSTGSTGRARNILNELLDVYVSDYSNKHINQEQVNNRVKNLADTDYDYLEMVETIDKQLEQTLETLNVRYMRAESFRSVDTGYSFADLRDQFSLIRDVEVSRLYYLILGNRITKDRELLLDKYQNRIANYGLDSTKAQEDMEDIRRVIDSYVDKMRQSGNTDIDSEYILSDVYEHAWLKDEEGEPSLPDRTVQYDILLRSWIRSRNNWDYARLDAAYCAYIIGVYRDGVTSLPENAGLQTDTETHGPATGTGQKKTDSQTGTNGTGTTGQNSQTGTNGTGTTGQSGQTGTKGTGMANQNGQTETNGPVDREPLAVETIRTGGVVTAAEVEEEIREVIERMNALYELVDRTNTEYNAYLGAANVRILSSASVRTAFNMRLYQSIIAFFFLLVGCCGAIVLGRLGDILEYLFLKDNVTGCMNRVACDRYIQRHEKLLMPAGMCCINFQIMNQSELNSTYGRNAADEVLKGAGQILREMFGNRRGSFIAYNGSGQFLAFFEKTEQETVIREAERLSLVLEQSLADFSVTYQMGAAGATEENQFRIRGLLSAASRARTSYTTRQES